MEVKDAAAESDSYSLSSVMHAQFGKDALHVYLDGLLADPEFSGNFFVAHAVRDVAQDLDLPRGKGWPADACDQARGDVLGNGPPTTIDLAYNTYQLICYGVL